MATYSKKELKTIAHALNVASKFTKLLESSMGDIEKCKFRNKTHEIDYHMGLRQFRVYKIINT